MKSIVIESINTQRSEQQFEAMYLLMSTTQNVDRIIADFSNGRQQYLAAHVFFIDGGRAPQRGGDFLMILYRPF